MLIDLKTPEIKFKTGNFSVDKNGYLVAKGGGSIAGWNIKNNELSKGTVGMSSNNSSNSNIAFWAGNTKPSDAPFSVNFKGDLKSTSMDIGGNIAIKNGQIYSLGVDNKEKNLYKFVIDSKTGRVKHSSGNNGFLLDGNGLSIGDKFVVSSSGFMRAKSGYIGDDTTGFSIKADSISNGTQGAKKSVYLGTNLISLGDTFKVSNQGELTASKGKIASWYFTDGAFYNQAAKKAADDDKEVGYGKWNDKTKKYDKIYENGMYFGNGGIRFGSNFHVGSNGNMYAVAGTIGGWTIGASSLTGGSLKLYSTGAINDSGDAWHIAANGEATFKNVKTANIKGGTISGGSRTGGSISPSGVSCGGYNNMNSWCEHIVATTVTADYIKSRVLEVDGRQASWKKKDIVTDVKLDRTYGNTSDGKQFVTSVTLTVSHSYGVYVLGF